MTWYINLINTIAIRKSHLPDYTNFRTSHRLFVKSCGRDFRIINIKRRHR